MNETATPTQRGFALRCLCCGETTSLTLDLDTLDTFRCPECNGDFTADDVREAVGQWQRVLAWIDLAPPLAAENAE
jgi:transcription initiation factor IIE alpha subunit